MFVAPVIEQRKYPPLPLRTHLAMAYALGTDFHESNQDQLALDRRLEQCGRAKGLGTLFASGDKGRLLGGSNGTESNIAATPPETQTGKDH
jgi:hypothetical protein